MNVSFLRKACARSQFYLIVGALSLPHLLLAQGDTSNGGGSRSVGLINPLAADSVVQLIGLVFNIITILLIPIAIFFLVRTGFWFVTAGGDPKKLERAKNDLFYVIIGIALILGAQLIGAILQNTLVGIKRG